MSTYADRFDTGTPVYRFAVFVDALRAADEGRERSPLEPLAVASVRAPDGELVELFGPDMEAVLEMVLR